jgi:hypothetical protein
MKEPKYIATDRNGVTTIMTIEQKRAAGPRWIKFERIENNEEPPVKPNIDPATIKGQPAKPVEKE